MNTKTKLKVKLKGKKIKGYDLGVNAKQDNHYKSAPRMELESTLDQKTIFFIHQSINYLRKEYNSLLITNC